MDAQTLTTIAASLATTATAMAPLAFIAWRHSRRLHRQIKALRSSVDFFDACNQGVVMVLRFPGAANSVAGLLIDHDFVVRRKEIRSLGERISDATKADLRAADVVVVEGLDDAGNESFYANAEVMECLRSGVGLIHVVPNRQVYYDQSRFRECDQSVTVPTTAITAVFTAIHRLRVMQRRAGVDPGGLAAARAERIG